MLPTMPTTRLRLVALFLIVALVGILLHSLPVQGKKGESIIIGGGGGGGGGVIMSGGKKGNFMRILSNIGSSKNH